MTAKKKHTVFPDEFWGKPVKVEFTNQGDINEAEPIVYPEKEQYENKTEPIIGANLFGNSQQQPKPRSHQDRLKDLFGDKAE
ncbi:MAG: hypothetical protein NWE99_08520 [Candidatus Bathyarchaeota archaeon]|nr:hypothetical protein [Candidatus Bathyarchaeota archaeon]